MGHKEMMTMKNKLLKELYDYFYVRPELDEQENEVEECHKALIEALAKPERKLVLRIIDAQNLIIEQTSLERALILLSDQENGRSLCMGRRNIK